MRRTRLQRAHGRAPRCRTKVSVLYIPLHFTRIMLTVCLAPPNIFDDIRANKRSSRGVGHGGDAEPRLLPAPGGARAVAHSPCGGPRDGPIRARDAPARGGYGGGDVPRGAPPRLRRLRADDEARGAETARKETRRTPRNGQRWRKRKRKRERGRRIALVEGVVAGDWKEEKADEEVGGARRGGGRRRGCRGSEGGGGDRARFLPRERPPVRAPHADYDAIRYEAHLRAGEVLARRELPIATF